jgi:hypothetical protein
MPFGINVVGTMTYHCFTSAGAVNGLTIPLHVPSNVSGVTQSSSASPGESLNLRVETVKLLGVFGPAAFHEILEMLALTVSTSGICSLVI